MNVAFDKEEFIGKYTEIYENLPNIEKRIKQDFKDAPSPAYLRIEPPKSRFLEEYKFFTSRQTPYEILGIDPLYTLTQIKKSIVRLPINGIQIAMKACSSLQKNTTT